MAAILSRSQWVKFSIVSSKTNLCSIAAIEMLFIILGYIGLLYNGVQVLYSPSGRTSYRKISRSLEGRDIRV